MPVPSIESVNGTSASNIGDLLQEGDFQKGIKITAFVFLMLLSVLGNALLIAVVYKNANQRMRTSSNYFIFNMSCADVLLTVYTVPVSSVSTVELILGYISSLMNNSFKVRNYCCRSYFRVVLKSQMKWKCWNRLEVKSKRTHHKHMRVETRGDLGTVQRTNNSIKGFTW